MPAILLYALALCLVGAACALPDVNGPRLRADAGAVSDAGESAPLSDAGRDVGARSSGGVEASGAGAGQAGQEGSSGASGAVMAGASGQGVAAQSSNAMLEPQSAGTPAAGGMLDAGMTALDPAAAVCAMCAPDAKCMGSGPTAACVCPATHSGDGKTCTPNPTCAALACDAHATCSEDPAPAHCACMPGWTGDGMRCSDVDECAQADKGGCPAMASCMNTPGSRVCTCKPGFEDVKRDGSECVDKCKLATCDANATCRIQGDSAVCSCNTGFTGDGKTCRVEDPCTKITCAAEATCTASGTKPLCQCKPGYMGDGFRCTPIPRCGDGTRNGNEQCDGRDLNGNTCTSLGHSGGTLRCDAASCVFDDSLCSDPAPPTGGSGAWQPPAGMYGMPSPTAANALRPWLRPGAQPQ